MLLLEKQKNNFTFMWPCIVIKATTCTNFTNLFCHEISASSWFYYKESCYDARSHERKIILLCFIVGVQVCLVKKVNCVAHWVKTVKTLLYRNVFSATFLNTFPHYRIGLRVDCVWRSDIRNFVLTPPNTAPVNHGKSVFGRASSESRIVQDC